MTGGYLYWQFISAPAWLIALAVNLQRALIRFFSVPIMLQTLLSHWHKDVVQYHGTISNRLLTLAWNLISRAIGFLIRTTVLVIWVISAAALFLVTTTLIITFVVWPFAIAGACIWLSTQL